MLFNSLAFMIFCPLFLIFYFCTGGYRRLWVCLAGSYLFYGWWDWRFLFLILISTAVNYLGGRRLEDETDPRRRRSVVIWNAVFNLSVLGFFKYFNFFTDSFNQMLGGLGLCGDIPTLNIILPVGISFYTFQAMSYVIDVFRGKMAVERCFLRFACYIAFFPQLVAGPIVRAQTFLPQLRTDHRFDWGRFTDGMEMVLAGFFIKVVIADSLALVTDRCLRIPEKEAAITLLVGVIFFAFQIYCDFDGYSRIAIGIGHIMGFDFGVNFNKPYFSASFSELWQRWHISLSSWLRDYLYIPLGGNRGSPLSSCRNLMLTMVLGGLWHGASWTFVIWGGLHGFYLILQRGCASLFRPVINRFHLREGALRPFMILIVFSLTCFAWIFFRAPSLTSALTIINGIGNPDTFNPILLPNKFLVLKGGLLITLLLCAEMSDFRFSMAGMVSKIPVLRWGKVLVMLWAIALLGTFRGNAFIYFQF
ncbi:MBOAT family protein [Desulfonema ishimotonii]|uniref:MBOAT family protein n=1 Tax=Desulfonema ishimotonii TaxID=45657 RepID=A0A401FVD6_9BACT|nr:MBOAT family O-acyltransferase [Desulfonema ishimotonii]GBC60921.1 MBOAT family protein [Desulfonema ishimotonii]